MDNNIAVSVFCITYNHEKYVRKCLEGFVAQKTDFNFEVFVHDDASTDSTADIIKEFAEKYPDIIKPILQKENQYSKGTYISKEFLLPITRGKYIAFCEGDDYWSDCNKLQKQFDLLESRPDCYMCTHIVRNCKENGELTDKTMPENPQKFNEIIDSKIFLKAIALSYCFQTCSYFVRADSIRKYWDNIPKFKLVSGTGDYPYMLYFASLGNIAYINDEMAVHRLASETSWSKTYITKPENMLKHYTQEKNMFEEYDIYTNGRYHDICQIAIDRVTFEHYMRSQNYKKVMKIKYLKFLKPYSFKSKLFVVYSALFKSYK